MSAQRGWQRVQEWGWGQEERDGRRVDGRGDGGVGGQEEGDRRRGDVGGE